MLRIHDGGRVCSGQVVDQLSLEEDLTSRSTDAEPWILSIQLFHRFQRFGELVDLQQGITLLEPLIKSTSVEDVRYRTGLANLGVAFRHRFNSLGQLSDLEDAISRLRSAADLTPHSHPDKHSQLSILGGSFLA